MRIDRDRRLLFDHRGSQQDASAVIGYLEIMGEASKICPVWFESGFHEHVVSGFGLTGRVRLKADTTFM
jgi:hypothetical protein